MLPQDQETLDLLSNPDWVDIITRGKQEVAGGAKGTTLDELAD